MESNLSCLSSLKEEDEPVYVQPHYKESYRLAIYALLCGGKEAYEEFLRAEQISHFLSEEEILYVFENAELPVVEDDDSSEGKRVTDEDSPSTYFPTESDEEVPDLDLGWPEVSLESEDTSISLLFNPPRQNTPTIKEVVRKQIQDARQVIAIAMDVFTDMDIFKEIITATLRGVVVYILLDDSQFRSFLTMSQKVGLNIQDLKNIRVRTVHGQQYRCQSGMKFQGDLEQRFLLVDCRTVLFGTYSYTWSFEKINLSMVLVITGQLVSTYDEEFRRLYARSTVPTALSKERQSVQYLRDTMRLRSPNSSQLALHQLHMRSKVTHGMRSAQDDRFYNGSMMTRGLSMQERLHQSHCFDMGNLMRGHSYGGELQKLHYLTRLRMGSKDTGDPFAPEKTGPNPRAGGDLLLPNRLSHHHLRHQTRYGADQNLIPFNSETSLHRWKMDTYFNDSDVPLDASCDTLTSMISPYSSHTGLNEHQSQLIQNRSRDIKSRMEEMRQKRLSLQDYSNFRQSHESLRSVYQAVERPRYKSGLDTSVAELEPNAQNGDSLEPANHKTIEPNKEVENREQTLTDGQRSASHCDVSTAPDRRTTQTYDWHEPLSRTTSAADFEMTLNDPSLKLSHLQPSGLQHPRVMESLTEIPEEKGQGSRVNSSDSAVFKDKSEEICKDEKAVPKENSVKSSEPAESLSKDETRGSLGSVGKAANGSGSAAPQERKESTSNEVQTVPKILNPSAESQNSPEAKSGHVEKKKAQRQEPPLQRKSSLRMKVSSMLSQDEKKVHKKDEKSLQDEKKVHKKDEKSLQDEKKVHKKDEKSLQDEKKVHKKDEKSLQDEKKVHKKDEKSLQDEKKVHKKEEKSLQRKASLRSLRSLSSSGSNQTRRADHSEAPAQATKKGQSPSVSRSPSASTSPSSPGGPAETERQTSPFPRLSSQRSSKKKTSPAGEQGQGSRSAPDDEGATVHHTRKTKVYSRFEYLMSAESVPPLSQRDGRSSLNRHDSMNQTQSDNKLGRFMQRVGHLISKNK